MSSEDLNPVAMNLFVDDLRDNLRRRSGFCGVRRRKAIDMIAKGLIPSPLLRIVIEAEFKSPFQLLADNRSRIAESPL
jgi:hypothetical protein